MRLRMEVALSRPRVMPGLPSRKSITCASGSAASSCARTAVACASAVRPRGGVAGNLNSSRRDARLPGASNLVLWSDACEIMTRGPITMVSLMRSGSCSSAAVMRKLRSPRRNVSPTCALRRTQKLVGHDHRVALERLRERHRWLEIGGSVVGIFGRVDGLERNQDGHRGQAARRPLKPSRSPRWSECRCSDRRSRQSCLTLQAWARETCARSGRPRAASAPRCSRSGESCRSARARPPRQPRQPRPREPQSQICRERISGRANRWLPRASSSMRA